MQEGRRMTVDARAITEQELRVFISYRRDDCQSQANGLHDGLRHRLSSARIFMDIDSIPYGVDFEQHIRDEIAKCDVVLVLIGDNWLDHIEGRRRIDDPADFVRLELENALSEPSVRVLPVLVEDARMPGSNELPESIRRLARLNAIEISDKRWQADLARLAEVIETIGAPRIESAADVRPEHAESRLDQYQQQAVSSAWRPGTRHCSPLLLRPNRRLRRS